MTIASNVCSFMQCSIAATAAGRKEGSDGTHRHPDQPPIEVRVEIEPVPIDDSASHQQEQSMSANADGAVRSGPLVILRLEGAAMFAILSGAYAWSGQSWWIFAGVFFVPDLSMVAYLANARVGAAAYNASHSTVAPALLGLGGLLLGSPLMPWLAVIWAAHIGFDRMFGYGLKYASSFGDTHLGRVGASEVVRNPTRRFRLCSP